MKTGYLSCIAIMLALAAYSPCCKGQERARAHVTRTTFTTSDAVLQKLYVKAVARAAKNIKYMGKRMDVLIHNNLR